MSGKISSFDHHPKAQLSQDNQPQSTTPSPCPYTNLGVSNHDQLADIQGKTEQNQVKLSTKRKKIHPGGD